MVLRPFHTSHREICARNRCSVPGTKFLGDFLGPLSLPAPLFYCWVSSFQSLPPHNVPNSGVPKEMQMLSEFLGILHLCGEILQNPPSPSMKILAHPNFRPLGAHFQLSRLSSSGAEARRKGYGRGKARLGSSLLAVSDCLL